MVVAGSSILIAEARAVGGVDAAAYSAMCMSDGHDTLVNKMAKKKQKKTEAWTGLGKE